MIVTKLWFVAWFLDFYDKNAILLKEAGSTRFQNLQERFGNILRIAPLLFTHPPTTHQEIFFGLKWKV